MQEQERELLAEESVADAGEVAKLEIVEGELAERVRKLTGAALLECGFWACFNEDEVEIQECSGMGGGKTYMVSNTRSDHRSVGFHDREVRVRDDPKSESRMALAAEELSSLNLAPTRLAQSSDLEWFIDVWAGCSLSPPGSRRDLTATEAHEAGQLLAKIHQIPIGWYDEPRQQSCENTRALAAATLGSHIWWWTAQARNFEGLGEDAIRRWVEEALRFAPISTAASRVVTCHGDFQPSNLIRTTAGTLEVIDFDYTCVGCAALDIAWLCATVLKGITQKRLFAGVYLKAMGDSHTQEQIDEFLLDAEIFSAVSTCVGPLAREVVGLKGDSALPLCLTEAYSLLATEAREHPATAADILEHGFFHCKRARALEMSFKPAGLTLVARGATTALILNGQSREGPKEYTLSLANQPEHALVLASEDYCGQSLGPSDSAMRIVSDDPFLRRGDNLSRVFDCAVTGEYEEGTTVGMFDKHGCDNQKFVVNDDWTVSPLLAPSMVLGWWSGPQKTDVDPLNGAAVFAAQNPAPVSIIIRGPSGSGKSTMADAVVKSLRDAGRQVCVLEQDYVRKTMLGSGKSAAEVSAEMLRVCADAALGQGYDVILEGILNSDPSKGGMYRPLLQSLCNRNGPTLLFYLDVPIETTKARHAGRSKAAKFGPEKLDVWWQSSQKTGLSGEIIIRSSDMDADRTAATILRHLHDCGA